jgi:CRP/FNR family transcriptional regulator
MNRTNCLSPVNPALFAIFASDVLPAELSEQVHSRIFALAHGVNGTRQKRIKIDDNCDQIVFLAKGATKLVAHAPAGREQIVAFNFAGDLICVSGKAAHSYSLYALNECALLTFPLNEFISLAREDLLLLGSMLDRVIMDLFRCREKTVSLGRKTAEERVGSFLSGMAERIGKTEGRDRLLTLPMSRRDIADSLGLTIETVSRQFREYRDKGLVSTTGRSIVRLHDIKQIEARAGHLPIAA